MPNEGNERTIETLRTRGDLKSKHIRGSINVKLLKCTHVSPCLEYNFSYFL